MKKETNLTLGISEPEKVDDFLNNLEYPLLDVVKYIRAFILSIDKNIGEGIYWNVPTFYFTGKLEPFDAKEYKRYIVGFNFFKKDCIRLIFLKGALVNDAANILEGDYKDGRRIVNIFSLEDLKQKEKALKKIVKELISIIKNK
jgi:hypothetical protein